MDAILHALQVALPDILGATLVTIICALIAGVLAMVFAIPAGLGRLSRVTVIRIVSAFYVETIRGTPLLLQLVVWYYGVRILLLALFNLNVDTVAYNLLTAINSNNLYPQQTGVSNFFFALLALGFNYGAYLAEIIRAGVLAVEHGQTEASLSLGLSRLQTMRLIILPQALRLMTPPLTNNFITLIQDTAFLSILGVTELSLRTQSFALAVSNAPLRLSFYGVELVIYFILCFSLASISRRMEQRTTPGLARLVKLPTFGLPGGRPLFRRA
jgi:polar amino acid transport system permease protein